jgi:hypothetical protein
MRNRTTFALPLRFTWRVARAGYQWVETKTGRFLCASDALRPDRHDVFDRYVTTYRPLEDRTGLFREFADLNPTEAGVLKFANRFGLLQRDDNLTLDSEFGLVSAHGEPLDLWSGEIKSLRSALSLWELIRSGKSSELRAELAKRDLPLAVKGRLHIEDDDPAMAALSPIQKVTDGRLLRNVETRLLFHEDSPRLGISLMPRDLLGAVWLQFAVAVDALKNFAKCAQCGAPFEVSRAPRTGKRPDALFCSTRCRVGNYRGRIDQARRLKSEGLPVNEIARKLKSEVRTVNGWLEASEHRARSSETRRPGALGSASVGPSGRRRTPLRPPPPPRSPKIR